MLKFCVNHVCLMCVNLLEVVVFAFCSSGLLKAREVFHVLKVLVVLCVLFSHTCLVAFSLSCVVCSRFRCFPVFFEDALRIQVFQAVERFESGQETMVFSLLDSTVIFSSRRMRAFTSSIEGSEQEKDV